MTDSNPNDDFPNTISVSEAAAAANVRANKSLPTSIGQYNVLKKLAEHGQGIVYLAFDPGLERQVIIKVGKRTIDKRHHAAIINEGGALGRLEHPNIATAHARFFDDTNLPYLVMEYIEGRNLAELLRGKRYTPIESAKLIKTLAEALQHVHDLGVTHRDIKPSNIIIGTDGVPKIIDFGLAKTNKAFYVQDDEASSGGTIPYMSPEQATDLGKSEEEVTTHVDGLSDVFSLGAMLFELLTGSRLYEDFKSVEQGLELAKECKIRTELLDQIDAPANVKEACLKAIKKSSNERFQSASDFADALACEVPEESSRPKLLLMGGVLAAAILMAWLGWNYFATDSGLVEVKQFDIDVYRNENFLCPIQDLTGGLKDGDAVRFKVQLSEPAYIKLTWLDGSGKQSEVYPNVPRIGYQGEKPVTVLESPSKGDQGWPLDAKGEIEFAVLMVSRKNLFSEPSELAGLWSELLDQSPKSVRRFVMPLAAKMETEDIAYSPRGLQPKATELNVPEFSFLKALQQHADSVHAIRIPIEYGH